MKLHDMKMSISKTRLEDSRLMLETRYVAALKTYKEMERKSKRIREVLRMNEEAWKAVRNSMMTMAATTELEVSEKRKEKEVEEGKRLHRS